MLKNNLYVILNYELHLDNEFDTQVIIIWLGLIPNFPKRKKRKESHGRKFVWHVWIHPLSKNDKRWYLLSSKEKSQARYLLPLLFSRFKAQQLLNPPPYSPSSSNLSFQIHSGTQPLYAIRIFGRFFHPRFVAFSSIQAEDGIFWRSFTLSLQPTFTPSSPSSYYLLLPWISYSFRYEWLFFSWLNYRSVS